MDVLIIGNGKSRSKQDLASIPREVTIGCNKIYQEMDPDYIVAGDPSAIIDVESNWEVPNKETRLLKWDVLTSLMNQAGSNSGIYAVNWAATKLWEPPSHITLSGFDCFISNNDELAGSNTFVYSHENNKEVKIARRYNIMRTEEFERVFKKWSHIQFSLVFPEEIEVYPDVVNIDNVQVINYTRNVGEVFRD